MAFAVVAIHTCPWKYCENEFFVMLMESTVQLAVPFFFLASGFLLSKKIDHLSDSSSVDAINKQLIKTTKMYLLWMLIYTPLDACYKVYRGIPLLESILLYIRGLFLVGEQYNSWPLWFLLSSIYALFVIKMLIRLKISFNGLIVCSAAFLFIRLVVDWIVSTEMQLPYALLLLSKVIQLSISDGRIFSGLIYIPLGMYLGHNSLTARTSSILLLVCFCLRYCILNSYIKIVLLIFMSVGFWGIIEKIYLPDNKIFFVLRKFSTIIYLIHMYVWTIYYSIVYKEIAYGLDSFLVTSVISLVIAWLYLFIKDKTLKFD